MLQNNPTKMPMPPRMDTTAGTVDIHVWMLIPAARITITEASGHRKVLLQLMLLPFKSLAPGLKSSADQYTCA